MLLLLEAGVRVSELEETVFKIFYGVNLNFILEIQDL